MIEISNERDKITKSLDELESEFKNGNVPESHYKFQKRRLTGRLEILEAAERVMKLQGKEITEAPVESGDESENDDLFKKYIASPGLKEKNTGDAKGISQNAMMATALLFIAFVAGIGLGIHTLNMPEEVPRVSLTNDSAFPPFVRNNTSNMTNTSNITRQILNTSEPVSSPVTQPPPATTAPVNETTAPVNETTAPVNESINNNNNP